jgi:hypothetical protein
MKRKISDMGEISLSAQNEWYLFRGFHMADSIIPLLGARVWGTVISPRGSVIGFDNPVAMDGPKDQMIGFSSAHILQFPVNRHILLYGTNSPTRPRVVNRKPIAQHNTLTMLAADEHLYSHEPDFCWLGNWEGSNRLEAVF